MLPKKLYICFLITCSLFALPSWATDSLKISLYHGTDLQKIFINPSDGVYTLITDNGISYELKSGDWLRVTKKEGAFSLTSAFRDFGLNRRVKIIKNSDGGLLKILPEEPRKIEQWYQGGLELVYGIKGVKMLNVIDLELYTAGVVEAESGAEQNVDYYKVQAIICRTFAISNQKKHVTEGFNLCDQVHCQVYHGKPRAQSNIQEAINGTKGMVLVDSNLKLIEAVFHSNCGGHTVNSEDYWSGNIEYLRGVPDLACQNQPHWDWTFSMSSQQWRRYLEDKFSFPVSDSVHMHSATHWVPEQRGKWFLNKAFNIPLRSIRQDWRLKSTNFEVEEIGDKVFIKGKGFGHGVGVCQEGAMVRSKSQRYSDILHFYYRDVFIVDKANVSFYKDFY